MLGVLSNQLHWSIIFSFVSVFVPYAMNNIAEEIEMPFGNGANYNTRACFEAAQGLLLYMGATENMGLRFGVQNKKLSKFFEKFDVSIAANFGSHGFSDSSWGVPNPFAGHSVFLAGGPIAWQSRKIKAKLSITGDSSCETEYASAASIAKELNYLRNLDDPSHAKRLH